MAAFTQLCNLINSSLLPYIEPKPTIVLNKETEKDLLLSLSRVSREIKKWTDEINCTSGEESPVKALSDHNCHQHLVKSCRDVNNCLANIVALIVPFLGFDSKFVHHSAGNILISVSSLLSQYGSKWDEFIHFLWISIEILVSNIYSSMSSSSPVGFSIISDKRLMHLPQIVKVFEKDGSNLYFAKFAALLQSRLMNMDLLMVASLFRILRSILKSLEHDSNDRKGVFMHLAISSHVKVSWGLLSKIHVNKSVKSEVCCVTNGFPGKRICFERQKDVFLGNVLQLFCSLSEQKDSEYSEEGFQELAIYAKVADLVPQLFSSCFRQRLGCNDESLSQYLRHKLLVLMIRLSFHKHWQNSYPTFWLKLLKEHFEDLLCEPISQGHFGFQSCLQGSPFLASVADADKVQYPCAWHLQRQAIFLLFRCCFTLILISKDSSQRCDCVFESSSCRELKLCIECCCLKGMPEIFEWFQRCGLMENFVNYENYQKMSSSFALSFLQLYIEDDDMLFEMLLQLLDAPFFAKQIQNSGNDISFEDQRKDLSSLFSDVFNPVRLFYLFLSLLHYDHLVLVDYLISKDTGILCVKYLLRCLRIICNSWATFVHFSIFENDVNRPYQKRRKISIYEDCSRKLGPIFSSSEVAKRQHSRSHKQDSMNKCMDLQSFINAKECLLSLKRSVEDLHHKNLFPYNPKPLLKSFCRFEELCAQ